MHTSATPIYARIQESLRHRMATGELREGDRMPSEAELASDFRTTRGTVRQALTRLVYEGLIVREVGRGTFVAPPTVESTLDTTLRQSFEEQMAARGLRVALRLLHLAEEPASQAVAEALQLMPGEPVARLKRLRLIEGDVVGFEDRLMLVSVGRRLAREALTAQSAIALVETALGGRLGRIAVAVRAAIASGEIGRLLELKRGSPVLVRAHTFFALDGRPVLHGQSVYRGDKYQFSYVFDKGRLVSPSGPIP